jgi:hypothetical protein
MNMRNLKKLMIRNFMMIMGWMILIPFTQTCVQCVCVENLDEVENCVTDVYWTDS